MTRLIIGAAPLLAGLVFSTGCLLFEPLETPCTTHGCGPGYTRLETADECTCRLSAHAPAGNTDAGHAAPSDAGLTDAGLTDAGLPDAGQLDAGAPDGGPTVRVVVRGPNGAALAPDAQAICDVEGADISNFELPRWTLNDMPAGMPNHHDITVPAHFPLGATLSCTLTPTSDYTPPPGAQLSADATLTGTVMPSAVMLVNGASRLSAYAGETLTCHDTTQTPHTIEMRYAPEDTPQSATPVAMPAIANEGVYYCVDTAEPRRPLVTMIANAAPDLLWLAAGTDAMCASYTNGYVRCAGTGPMAGALRADTAPAFVYAETLNGPPALLQDVSTIYARTTHACVLRSDASVWCWGEGGQGQLGNRAFVDSRVAVEVHLGNSERHVFGVEELGVGNSHACIRNTLGHVACWGAGGHNQLGRPSGSAQAFAEELPADEFEPNDLVRVDHLDVGGDHACAVRTDHPPGGDVETTLCWGRNDTLQLGGAHSELNARRLPGVPPNAMALDTLHSCGMYEEGIKCWGDPFAQRLGTPDTAAAVGHTAATVVPSVVNPFDLRTNGGVTCARGATQMWCWGDNDAGVANPQSPASSSGPAQIGLPTAMLWDYAIGGTYACAVEEASRAVRCWGNPAGGQVGATLNARGPSAPLDVWLWPGRPGPAFP